MNKKDREKKLEQIFLSQIDTFYDELIHIKKIFKVS